MTSRKCEERVSEPPGYWYDHTCGRRAKFMVNGRWRDDRMPVCGIHVKWYQKHRPESVETIGREIDE